MLFRAIAARKTRNLRQEVNLFPVCNKNPGALYPRISVLFCRSTRHLSLELTLTVTQSESGIVTRTRTKETKVRMVAQIPGPSSSAEKEGGD